MTSLFKVALGCVLLATPVAAKAEYNCWSYHDKEQIKCVKDAAKGIYWPRSPQQLAFDKYMEEYRAEYQKEEAEARKKPGWRSPYEGMSPAELRALNDSERYSREVPSAVGRIEAYEYQCRTGGYC